MKTTTTSTLNVSAVVAKPHFKIGSKVETIAFINRTGNGINPVTTNTILLNVHIGDDLTICTLPNVELSLPVRSSVSELLIKSPQVKTKPITEVFHIFDGSKTVDEYTGDGSITIVAGSSQKYFWG